ncbi:hypothetical protein K469DRAFT_63802 [Zopfia rhizophila CBS 207.26]|uniref:Uncharacterized protein n=1 Tax=Zopfia rhizophila CBS 207.26 TaxID=1314779 RepID=A0A6A6EEU6_9PEZI|nr:hypothetical protein K469DRAFT_63802 [Zopfia rhizophila CBS 207.26]
MSLPMFTSKLSKLPKLRTGAGSAGWSQEKAIGPSADELLDAYGEYMVPSSAVEYGEEDGCGSDFEELDLSSPTESQMLDPQDGMSGSMMGDSMTENTRGREPTYNLRQGKGAAVRRSDWNGEFNTSRLSRARTSSSNVEGEVLFDAEADSDSDDGEPAPVITLDPHQVAAQFNHLLRTDPTPNDIQDEDWTQVSSGESSANAPVHPRSFLGSRSQVRLKCRI